MRGSTTAAVRFRCPRCQETMVWPATRRGAGTYFDRTRAPAVRSATGVAMADGVPDYTILDGNDVFDPWTWPEVGGVLLRCRCMKPAEPHRRYSVLELRALIDAMRPGQPFVLAPLAELRDFCETTRPHRGARRPAR